MTCEDGVRTWNLEPGTWNRESGIGHAVASRGCWRVRRFTAGEAGGFVKFIRAVLRGGDVAASFQAAGQSGTRLTAS